MVRENYKWDVVDWSDLEATIPHAWDNFVGEKDVDRFATEAMVLASLSTGVSLQELVEKNQEFYDAKKQLFESFDCVAEDNPQLMRVEMLLKIPA